MSPLVILITRATAGIGRAAAISLAREGHHVPTRMLDAILARFIGLTRRRAVPQLPFAT